MPSTVASETLGPLRQRFASIERSSGFPFGAEEAGLPLGLPALDGALGGGLAFGALHEIAPAAPIHLAHRPARLRLIEPTAKPLDRHVDTLDQDRVLGEVHAKRVCRRREVAAVVAGALENGAGMRSLDPVRYFRVLSDVLRLYAGRQRNAIPRCRSDLTENTSRNPAWSPSRARIDFSARRPAGNTVQLGAGFHLAILKPFRMVARP